MKIPQDTYFCIDVDHPLQFDDLSNQHTIQDVFSLWIRKSFAIVFAFQRSHCEAAPMLPVFLFQRYSQ
jgi:hypothetical protein